MAYHTYGSQGSQASRKNGREPHMVYGMRLPHDPKRAVKEMITLMERLKTFYERETLALKNADIQGFLSMQDEKMALARFCQDGAAQILARKAEMRDVDVSLKKKLRDLQNEFQSLCAKNLKEIGRMKRVSSRLSHTIQRVARTELEKENTINYAHDGQVFGRENAGLSIGLNQTA